MYQALTRSVSTILSADVKGFSRLVCRNDVAAVLTINQLRHLIALQVELHHGRVVDMAGDSILAVFGGALNAVRCGIAMQERLWARNRRLPVEERMCFRLGIDQGSVLHQGERIYGEAVNTAARLQTIAPPGGVIISAAVYRQVNGRLPLDAEYQGEMVLKNIPKRVATYRLLSQNENCNLECDSRILRPPSGQPRAKPSDSIVHT